MADKEITNSDGAPLVTPVITRRSGRSQGLPPPEVSFGDNLVPAMIKKLSSESGWNVAVKKAAEKPPMAPVPTPVAPRKKRKLNETDLATSSPYVLPVASKEGMYLPSPVRHIVESESLSILVRDNSMCRKCRLVGTLSLTFSTNCIASEPQLSCTHCKWKIVAPRKVTATKQIRGQDPVARFDTNMKYVLGFVLSGDGGSEAQKVLSLLGLPNSTTMKRSSFTKVEDAMYEAVLPIMKSALNESLIAEVKATPQDDDFDFELWKLCVETGQDPPLHCRA